MILTMSKRVAGEDVTVALVTSRRHDRNDPWSERVAGGSIRGAGTPLADLFANRADD